MDKKSFLRGFGTGVLFAAVILGISFSVRTSKGQVIAQAREYGMVFPDREEKLFSSASPNGNASPSASSETTVSASPTADPTDKKDNTDNDKSAAVPTVKPQQANKASATPKPTAKKADSSKSSKAGSNKTDLEKEKAKMDKEKEKVKKSIENEKKKLTISAGEWSDSVSRKLLNMGIIKNAKDFDSYLNRYGYSSRIVAGTYDVSPSDTYAELAKKITGRR